MSKHHTLPLFRIAAFSSLTLLAACGGGGGGSSSTPSSNQSIEGRAVAGPLDPVQEQLSSGVFAPLASSAAGTPLEAVVLCGEAVVNQDVLDLADTVLVSLQAAPANPGSADPAALTDSLTALVADLTGLLQSLAGASAACATPTASFDDIAQALTMLNGTPLEPIATQLGPVMQQIAATLASSGSNGQDQQLASVAALVSQLNNALQLALSQIPADAYATPIVGATLATVSTALNDATTMLNAAATYNSAGTSLALQTLLNNALVNVTTQIVPIVQLEDAAGQPGALSLPLMLASAQIATVVGGSVGQVLTPVFDTLLADALAPLLDPIENDVLPMLLDPITAALAGGGSDPTGPLSGTVLAPAVNAVTEVLAALGLGATSGQSCLFSGVPLLSVLCGST
jgi:hypothetical protein